MDLPEECSDGIALGNTRELGLRDGAHPERSVSPEKRIEAEGQGGGGGNAKVQAIDDRGLEQGNLVSAAFHGRPYGAAPRQSARSGRCGKGEAGETRVSTRG
ncbi:hypothetical protein AAY81_07490 [Denitrobacterium detoxificans]|nr:hypothetical protein AAY81_07490 [Denitrobacterium detoxificans]